MEQRLVGRVVVGARSHSHRRHGDRGSRRGRRCSHDTRRDDHLRSHGRRIDRGIRRRKDGRDGSRRGIGRRPVVC